MEPAIVRGLNDKFYEKRKSAALDLEKLVRECHAQRDVLRITQIIDQLIELFATTTNPLHCRNGGLIGLAATAIALSVEIAPYMEKFIEPLLRCFSDPESRIRYFACESMYNIAKVSKGEILVYFNPIFDALSKLAADSELSVKNGAELLDRLLKDIVAESAPVYIPQFAETEKVRQQAQEKRYGLGILVPENDEDIGRVHDFPAPKKAFSLAHFIPLLSERIYVVSPLTRSYLVSWINVLDSVPDLELVTFLPEFLDGLLKYLSDPTEDVRVATENLLADFLREVRDIAVMQKKREEKFRAQQDARSLKKQESKGALSIEIESTREFAAAERGAFLPEVDAKPTSGDTPSSIRPDTASVAAEEEHDTGAWIPGQGVSVDHAAIIEILIQQLDPGHDEIQQSTALLWLAGFLDFAQDVMVPFTPRLIPAILPNLASHVPGIQSAANSTNQSLYAAIQNLPSPTATSPRPLGTMSSSTSLRTIPMSPPPSNAPPIMSRTGIKDGGTTAVDTTTTVELHRSASSLADWSEKAAAFAALPAARHRPSTTTPTGTPSGPSATLPAQSNMADTSSAASVGDAASVQSRSHSPTSIMGTGVVPSTAVIQASPALPMNEEFDPIDYQETVNALTLQFLSEHEETRVASLKWLLMLHQKAPKKILAMDDGTFPALLKTLSDPSEEVIKHDLQLLAQISSSSEEGYFKSFMINLLDLFSTDRRLLEIRGSLIIRQLCLSLNTERIYRTFAEILEKEEDLEFASIMVQRLNIILITSPELSEFRKRLKNLESRDGQALFSTLYKSWCHNAMALFALCLLAQAYEHASNLLPILAELEITVQLLVQIDKLVQLIESPVFTSLRLQLLEPEKYPYLFKCLYGLLMLLPQSSAFFSLRNRLNAVSSLGFIHVAPKASTIPTRSKMIREEIKWSELLSHFRALQAKHEKSRRQGLAAGGDTASILSFTSAPATTSANGNVSSAPSGTRPPLRRKVTNDGPPTRLGGTALSPLNPKARAVSGIQSGLLVSVLNNATGGTALNPPGSPPPPASAATKRRTTLGLNTSRKPPS